MSAIHGFVEKSRAEIKARPILPFGAGLRLGAYGVLEDDQWSPRGQVETTLGIPVGEVSVASTKEWQDTSGQDVQMNFLGKGEVSKMFPDAPSVKARVEIEFGSSESFLVSVGAGKVRTLTDPAQLLSAIQDALIAKIWFPEYVLVYELIEPASSLILVGKSADSKFMFDASAKVKLTGTANLAGKVTLTYSTRDALKLEGGGEPLFFNGYRVNVDWLGRFHTKIALREQPIAGIVENAFIRV